jgi:cobalamin biosynthesis protein CobT
MAKEGDLRRQLGAFVRSALHQLDTVREVVVQKSKEGRIQLELGRLRRRRKDALAELGAVIADLAAAGRISEDTFPEISAALSQLEALDERIGAEEARARGEDVDPGHEEYYDEDEEDENGKEAGEKDDLDSGSRSG